VLGCDVGLSLIFTILLLGTTLGAALLVVILAALMNDGAVIIVAVSLVVGTVEPCELGPPVKTFLRALSSLPVAVVVVAVGMGHAQIHDVPLASSALVLHGIVSP